MICILDKGNGEELIERFREVIEKSTVIPDELWGPISEMLICKQADKDDCLLENGKHENFVRYVVKGHIKIIYHENDPYVYDFRSGEHFLCDTGSLFERKPSQFSFQALSPIEWVEIKRTDFLKLLKINDAVKQAISFSINGYLQRSQEGHAFIRSYDAAERYRIFCREKPEILKLARLGDIASYLNITQQSLSRIRKKEGSGD